MNHKLFISSQKSLLIAPAGHGKTHSIVDCLKHTSGKQLILTHTHAGVASIKEKLKLEGISTKVYHVETITSFAQKYVLAFYTGQSMPNNDNKAEYYPFLIKEGSRIISLKIVSKIISATYAGLFVDEYQDCTLSQHRFVSILSRILPTRILGDPLQGIFNFNDEPMVDLENKDHIGDFLSNSHKLIEPWRWKKSNEQLGQALIKIRADIEAKTPINLTNYPQIECILIDNESDLYIPSKSYYQKLSKLLGGKSLLLIHPDSTSINQRVKVASVYRTPISLIEAVDDLDFYKLAALCDTIDNSSTGPVISKIVSSLFNKTASSKWFNEKGLVNKKKPTEQAIIKPISDKLQEIIEHKSYSKVYDLLKMTYKLPDIVCYRKDLLYSLFNSLVLAQTNSKSVYDSMCDIRNRVRRVGRKIHGRCIGTTLLTKGLEFDTVIILNGHKFTCPKNLYVALTRASKRLIVFTTNPVLSPKY